MIFKPSEVTTLRAELTRLGLIDRVNMNGLSESDLDHKVLPANRVNAHDTGGEHVGELFSFSSSGYHLYTFQCVARFTGPVEESYHMLFASYRVTVRFNLTSAQLFLTAVI